MVNSDTISILHDYSRNIDSQLELFDHLTSYLGNNPFGTSSFTEVDKVILAVLDPLVGILKHAIKFFIKDIAVDFEGRNISTELFNALQAISEDINTLRGLGTAVYPFKARRLANRVVDTLQTLRFSTPRPRINKDKTRELLDAAKELQRVVCLFDIQRLSSDVIAFRDELRAIIAASRFQEPDDNDDSPLLFASLLREAVDAAQKKAITKNIHFRFKNIKQQIDIKASPKDLRKAIDNVLDNAIKYTGYLPPDSIYQHTWVDVTASVKKKAVYVSVESWGTPITHEEYEGQMYFRVGFRGRFARVYNIAGTGTGLFDTKNLFEKYKGGIKLETKPISKNDSGQDSTKTTVTFWLPIFKEV
jgi:signal transduction histidine kinase